MRKLVPIFVLGMLGLAAACGSDSKKSTDAGAVIEGGMPPKADGTVIADAPVSVPDASVSEGDVPAAGGEAGAAVEGGLAGDGAVSEGGGSSSDAMAIPGTEGGAACPLPSCLVPLMKDCAPVGTCTMALSTATGSLNVCYANGVTVSTAIATRTMAVKNAAGICYTAEMDANSVATFKNAAGTTVATGVQDTAGNLTVTCTGAPSVLVTAACGSGILGAATGANCTQGTCAP